MKPEVAFGLLEASAHDPEGRRLDAGTPFVAMEWLEGPTLCQHIEAQGALTAEQATQCAQELGDALGVLHAHNLVHLDVKPEKYEVHVRRLALCSGPGARRDDIFRAP